MEEKELETFLKEMKKEALSHQERASLWHSIYSSISAPRASRSSITIQSIMKKRYVPILISLVLLAGLAGGTTALAHGTVPGDFLYPVNRAVENIRLAIASPEQKDALRIAYSVKRVDEVERILVANNITLSQVTGTTTATTSPKSLDAAKKGLEIALSYIEDSKQKFEDAGNASAVATLTLIAERLADMADNHLAELDKLSVKINDNGKNTKTEVQAISNSIKTKFKIEEKKNGNVNISISTSTVKNDSKGKKDDDKEKKDNKDKGGKKDDHDDDRDDDRDDDKKITICHNRKETITVSKNALWAHLKHGDTQGACSGNNQNNGVPAFTSVSSNPEKTTAKIMWQTNENTTSTVWYGTTTPVAIATGTARMDDDGNGKGHDLTLTGLTPDTLYYYVITAKDSDGNTATSSERSFRTQKEDATAPIISNVSSNAGTSTARIVWNTNESTTGTVYVGTSSPLTTGNSAQNASSATGSTTHAVSFAGLVPNTTYRFFIVAKDAFENYATSSTMTFTTDALPPAPDTTAPTISSLTATDIATTTAKITFTTNEGATSKVWYATSTPVATSGTADQNIATFITGHTYNLSSLVGSTTYHYIVTATDSAGNTSTSTEKSFTTL